MNNNLEFENEDPSPDSIEDNHPRTNYGEGWECSKEHLREAYFSAIKDTGEGWNGEYANGNHPNIKKIFNKSFEDWFEKFKNKKI